MCFGSLSPLGVISPATALIILQLGFILIKYLQRNPTIQTSLILGLSDYRAYIYRYIYFMHTLWLALQFQESNAIKKLIKHLSLLCLVVRI